MSNLITYLELIEKVNSLVQKVDLSDDSETILDFPNVFIPLWVDYIGETLEKGTLILYNDIKYLVMQTHVPLETQPPDSTGMLAVYQPYQGRYGYDWVYGEYCEIGFTRYYNNILYEAYQDPNANIYSPDLVPTIWTVKVE